MTEHSGNVEIKMSFIINQKANTHKSWLAFPIISNQPLQNNFEKFYTQWFPVA